VIEAEFAYLQLSTTAATREDAERIAAAVLEARLAACAQILGPIASRYWWRGTLETSEEYLVLLKARASAYAACERAIRNVHPYENPEIIAVPIVAGSPAYLAWIAESTVQPEGAP
jgi:periplasmic divalent cation tolerance protein